MQTLKTEVPKLIQSHLKELNASAGVLGGVFITGKDGAVAVIGVEGREPKTIFKTAFVSDNVDRLLDAQVLVQDLLEEEGIEAISEHDFNIALEEL